MSNDADNPTTLRGVLLAGATVFGLSAIALLVVPDIFLTLLGLTVSDELEWSMRMIAITLVALTGNMAVVSRHSAAGGVIVASSVMTISAGGLGVLTLLIPAEPTWFVIVYALVGFAFSAAYIVGLALWAKRPRVESGGNG
jgi:hypothetical protein